MPTIFDPAAIGQLRLRNRIVRSATWEGMCAEDGTPTDSLISLYENLVDGAVGLIITGYAYIRPEGKQNPGKLGIHDDFLIPSLKGVTRSVHARGGKIMAQLVHAGGLARKKVSGFPPVAPYADAASQYPEVPVGMTRSMIEDVVSAFAHAAVRAQEAGFDGVQLHGAHGYLIGQFLSPLTNRREDAYGGTPGRRSRFLAQVMRAVRKAVGDGYPVWIKLNGEDFLPGGFSAGEAREVATMLERERIDAIEVSGGTSISRDRTPARTGIDSPEKEAYHRDLARGIRKTVGVPVGLVGGLRSPSLLEEIFRAGDADFFSMARPLIREPDLVKRWMSGNLSRAECISCNGCFIPGFKEKGIYCVVKRKERAG